MGTSDIARKAAMMIAAARLAAGAVAVARPAMAARVWVGRRSGRDPGSSVLGRALGGRDLALAAGALAAAGSGDPGDLRRWTGAGALADAFDTAGTLSAWPHLPRGYRIAVLGASCGAALAGALATAGPGNRGPGNRAEPKKRLRFVNASGITGFDVCPRQYFGTR